MVDKLPQQTQSSLQKAKAQQNKEAAMLKQQLDQLKVPSGPLPQQTQPPLQKTPQPQKNYHS